MNLNMRSLLIFLLCGLFLLSCSTSETKKVSYHSDDPWNLDIKVEKVVLKNGLTILLVENHTLPIFSLYTFFDVGSKYERKGITGSSHFLEHLMFKGAKKYGPGVFEKAIETNGGSSNAYTTMDQTVYYENMPTKAIELIIDMEADRLENLLLEPKGFESERSVILEERKYRYENSPGGQLLLATTQAMFDGTPYGESVIGRIPDLKKVSRDEIHNYFKTHYAPNNAVVVIVGDIMTHEVAHLMKSKFGGIAKNETLDAMKRDLDDAFLYKDRAKYKKSHNIYGESPNPIFRLAYRGEPLGTRRSLVLDLLSSMLGDGKSSYLHQKYATGKKAMAGNIYAYNYNLQEAGSFFIGGQLLSGTSLKSFERKLKKETKTICKKALNERALQKTKNQYLVSYYNSLQTNDGVAWFLGANESVFGDYNTYKKELKTYRSIQLAEVKEVCHSVFDSGKNIFLSVWNKNPKHRRKF